MLVALVEIMTAQVSLVIIVGLIGGLALMIGGLKHAYDYFRYDGQRGSLWGGMSTAVVGLLLYFLVNVLAVLTGSTLLEMGVTKSYTDMSASMESVLTNTLGTDVAAVLKQLWAAIAVLCILIGLTSCVHALHSLGKRYRYDNPQYGDGKILLFFFGWILINITPIINYVGDKLQEWL